MPEPIRNVFISHKHEDDDGLQELKRLVRGHGMTWRDYSITADNPNNAHNEDYIKREILAPRIRQAGCLVVYISEKTKNSEWVNWEIEYAQRLGKRIVGVWARGDRDCDLPEALEDYWDALVPFPLEYALYRIFVSPVSHSRASRNPELEAAFQYQHI